MSEPVVALEAVAKRYEPRGAAALDGVSAVVEAGRVTGLVGPDGAGKTTLLRLVAALMLPDRGAARVFGLDTRTASDAIHERIGYMPQRFGLYEDLSVRENLELYAELRGLPDRERRSTFERLLEFTALEPFQERLARHLSGGMKQKLGLACALICAPRLLLLDEPSVGVDPISRRELWRMVQSLVGEGVAVVWSTAYLDEAELCDTVLLLNEGRLLYEGVPQALARRVDARVFHLRDAGGSRRAALARMLSQPAVMDGVIQGRNVRLLYREAGPPPALPDGFGAQAHLAAVAPRFEDGFVDALGGGPGGHSTLAELIDPIEDDGRAVIQAHGLTKRFGAFTAARDISFDIPRGEIFGLLGPNGAGKSTTFKMLCGLLAPSAGEGLVAGHDLRRAAAQARQRLGYMAQKFSLYGDLSVRQNLEFFAGVYGLGRRRRRDAIEAMVRAFDLAPHLAGSAKDLPLGFKQRLALACAVMHRPEVLFLDEPTSGVDPITRREFWTHINAMVEKGVTVLVTTHFMDEAEHCDRIALIFQGEIVAVGSPEALKARVAGPALEDPTLEDAFIELVRRSTRVDEEAA